MNQLFKIFKVDKAEATRRSALPDEQHQHDFVELIIGMAGELEHFIDFKMTTLDAPLVSFVTLPSNNFTILEIHLPLNRQAGRNYKQ